MTSAAIDPTVIDKKCLQERINSLELKDELPRPHPIGARIKVCYAGVDYLDIPYGNEPSITSSVSGRPVFAVAGTVDELGDSAQPKFRIGDKVIVFVRKDISGTRSEYVQVKDIADLQFIPDGLSMEVAAMLPYAALRAYSAIVRAKTFAEARIKPTSLANVLVVGAGTLGHWAIKFFNGLISDRTKFRFIIGDTDLHQLIISKDQGCHAVINWNDILHHDYVLSRTKQAFLNQGVDLAIDFISSVQTVSYIMTLLKEDGVILVSNNREEQMSFSLTQLSKNNQSVVGMNDGTIDQLETLINLIATNKVAPIPHTVYPAEEEAKVVELLRNGRITVQPVLQFSCVGSSDAADADADVRSSFGNLFI